MSLQERLGQQVDKLEAAFKLPAVKGASHLLRPQKPTCPPPAERRKTKVILARDRGARAASEQPAAGGPPQEGKSERERSRQGAAFSQTSPQRRVASSQFAGGSRCSPLETLELLKASLSERQLQPCQAPSAEATTAHVWQLSRALARETISRVQQRRERRIGGARTTLHGIPVLEREVKAKAAALASTLAARTMASVITDSVLDRVCQPGAALPPELKGVRRPV